MLYGLQPAEPAVAHRPVRSGDAQHERTAGGRIGRRSKRHHGRTGRRGERPDSVCVRAVRASVLEAGQRCIVHGTRRVRADGRWTAALRAVRRMAGPGYGRHVGRHYRNADGVRAPFHGERAGGAVLGLDGWFIARRFP